MSLPIYFRKFSKLRKDLDFLSQYYSDVVEALYRIRFNENLTSLKVRAALDKFLIMVG